MRPIVSSSLVVAQCCGSTDVIRYGKGANGVQRYRCHACAYTFREHLKPKGYTETEEEMARILAAYRERSSLRGLTRTFGASRTMISQWLKEQGEALSPLEEWMLNYQLLAS